MLFTTTLLAVRNQRILAAWNARQQENARRAAAGLPPKTRRRRRKTLTALTATRPPLTRVIYPPSRAPQPPGPHTSSGSLPANGQDPQKATGHAHIAHDAAANHSHTTDRPRMSDPNVKIGLTET